MNYITTTDKNQNPGKHKSFACPPHEVNVCFTNHMEHLERALAARKREVKAKTSHHQRSVHRSHDPDGKRYTKATNRATAHHDHDDTGKQGRQVTVKNHTKRTVITRRNGRAQRLALGKLFTNTLINQYVGIHRHTDRQCNTGNTRNRQSRANQTHHPQQDDDVQNHGYISQNTRKHVVAEHEQGNQHGTDNTGHYAAANRVRSQ